MREGRSGRVTTEAYRVSLNSDCCLQSEPQVPSITTILARVDTSIHHTKPNTTKLTCNVRVFLMMLCARCSQIFRGPCRHGEQDHYYSVRELEQAAFNKCNICRVLWQAISDKVPNDVRVNPTEVTGHRVIPSRPISAYRMRHKVLYTNEISELSFVVDQNGVLNGGKAFLFCLQNTSGKSTATLIVAKRALIS